MQLVIHCGIVVSVRCLIMLSVLCVCVFDGNGVYSVLVFVMQFHGVYGVADIVCDVGFAHHMVVCVVGCCVSVMMNTMLLLLNLLLTMMMYVVCCANVYECDGWC